MLTRADPVRIMTYNVHRCRGIDRVFSPERVAQVIASCHPDVIALQEVDVRRARSGGVDQAEVIARDLGMDMQFFPALQILDEHYGDAILSRLPMRLMKAGHLPIWRGREPRGALWASIDTGHGDLQVVNTHLGLRGRERAEQIDALLGPEWLAHPDCAEPLVAVGDFNAPPRSYTYQRLSRRLKDAARAAGQRPQATFPTRYPALRLDYIFVSSSIDVLNAGTVRTPLARFASDHMPLMAELAIPPSSARRSGHQPSIAHAKADHDALA